MSKTSAKANARYLGKLLKQHHCHQIVISPGSRNAPIITALANDPDYNCISVPDERTAGFTALGKCMASKKPVAVVCSSGSALANYYPAVTEAYYQKLPLVILSADRPLEWIDQGIGQTIRQDNIFENHIQYSANLLGEPKDELTKNYNQRQINQALLATKDGPVHINIPFSEPLYESVSNPEERIRFIEKVDVKRQLDAKNWAPLYNKWNKSPKILVLAGQLDFKPELIKSIESLHNKSPFLIFSETLSNLHCTNSISSIDRLINTISEDQKKLLKPDILITIGGEIVSKMVKKLLRNPEIEHWLVSESPEIKDSFLNLNKLIPLSPQEFFEGMLLGLSEKKAEYPKTWLNLDKIKSRKHQEFMAQSSYSDLQVVGELLHHLPKNSVLHTANSASVRYTQLFDQDPSIEHFANRGTSGIDGCSSTSLGFASMTDKIVTLLSGDIAFMYDSNAFWNNELKGNLRLLVINNNGGNIFRIIKGPKKDGNFEKFQETNHLQSAESIALRYSLSYQKAHDLIELKKELKTFYEPSERPKVLEVFTPRIESPEILQDYFRFLSLDNE
tara:strand:+ start:42582 stop:44267 length:1686 start_codon:yes stop_codon:yes gene_type:complete